MLTSLSGCMEDPSVGSLTTSRDSTSTPSFSDLESDLAHLCCRPRRGRFLETNWNYRAAGEQEACSQAGSVDGGTYDGIGQ